MFSRRADALLNVRPTALARVLFVALAGGLFFVAGDVVWRSTLSSDALYEVADGHAILKGRMLFHEFIPTYGFLYPLVVSLVLRAGAWAFSLLLLLGLGLVVSQALLLSGLLKDSRWWSLAGFLFLYFGYDAFRLSEGNFICGFSQSSVISATLLLLGAHLLVNRPGESSRRWVAVIAGLLPCVKEDFAVVGLALFLFTLVLLAKRKEFVRLLVIFGAVWGGLLAFLMIRGAEWPVLFWSAMDFPLSDDRWGADLVLRRRLGTLLLLALATAWMPAFLRKGRLARGIAPWRWLLLPAVWGLDLARTRFQGFLHVPLLRWLTLFVVMVVAADLLRRSLRRGPRFLRRREVLRLALPLGIALAGYLRVYKSGWYPFAMSEPFAFLVVWPWLTGPVRGGAGFGLKLARGGVLAGGVLIALANTWALLHPNPSVPCCTRLGWLALAPELGFRADVVRLLESRCDARGMFSSDPLFALALDVPPLNLHSVLKRLQVAQPLDGMERRLLHNLQSSPPKLVYLENLKNAHQKLFGQDHAVPIWRWIEANYRPVLKIGNGFDPSSRQAGATLFEQRTNSDP